MITADSKITISDSEFLSILTHIQNAKSLDNLFSSIIGTLGIKRISYHHLIDIGEFHLQDRKRYFSYNLPQELINFFENYYNPNNDPGVVKVFSKGHFVWLSDMLTDPVVIQKGAKSNIEDLISKIGDGLLIPLYGPQNRRGYLNLFFGKDKTVFAPLFSWQIQSLAQITHVKYTLMRLNLETKVKLTKRESDVLELITLGKTNPEIGIILQISTNTVSGYVKQIFLKFGTSDRVTTALRARSLSSRF